jgi:hypothetical protein
MAWMPVGALFKSEQVSNWDKGETAVPYLNCFLNS